MDCLPPSLRSEVKLHEGQRCQNLVDHVCTFAARVPSKQAAEGNPKLLTDANRWLFHIDMCALPKLRRDECLSLRSVPGYKSDTRAALIDAGS